MKNNFFILWFAGIVGTAAVLPYIFTVQHEIIEKSVTSLPLISIFAIAQTAVLLAATIFFGLKLAERLHLPTLTALNSGAAVKSKLFAIAKLAVPAGIVAGVLIILGDAFFSKYTPELTLAANDIAIWKTLLASLYGGIVEELFLRLFLMSLIAWILAKLFRSEKPTENCAIMWSAIIIAAIVFGLGHLPVTATLVAITPIVILRAIILNGIGGIIFGWLFWKKGLESAIIAHFTADIVFLTILPLLIN